MRLAMNWDPDDPDLRVDLESVDRVAYICRTLVPPGHEEYFREVARYRAVMSLVTGAPETGASHHQRANAEDAYALFGSIANDTSVRIENGLIRAMNSVLQRGLREHPRGGQFRTEARIITDGSTREMLYRPARAEHVPALMEHLAQDLQGWVDDGVPGPVVAALAHLGLLAIHPFEDGNERTARLISDMILVQTGMSVDGMLSASEELSRPESGYYRALAATLGHDFGPELDVRAWLSWYTEAILGNAMRLERDLGTYNQRLDYLRHMDGDAFNERQLLGVMFAWYVAPVSSSLYARLTGSSQSSAKADLNALVRTGALERVGSGRQTRYRATLEWAAAASAAEAAP